jgi:hypothetical protein
MDAPFNGATRGIAVGVPGSFGEDCFEEIVMRDLTLGELQYVYGGGGKGHGCGGGGSKGGGSNGGSGGGSKGGSGGGSGGGSKGGSGGGSKGGSSGGSKGGSK